MVNLIKFINCIKNYFPPCFGIQAISLSIDVGYEGIYFWLGKWAIGFGGEDLPSNGFTAPNYPYGIYIKLGDFEWTNWKGKDSIHLP